MKPAAAKSEGAKAASAKVRSQPPQAASTPPARTRSAILPLGVATAAVAGVLLWLGSGRDDEPPAAPEPPAHVEQAEQVPQRPEEAAPSEPEARAVPAEPAAEPTAEAEATATASAEAPAPSAAPPVDSAAVTPPSDAPAEKPEARADAEKAPDAPTPSAGEPVPSDEGLTEGPVTTIYMAPDCAELYRKGKRVGRSGVRVRTPEGKKRVYEVVCPGHGTRKLTLDGSRTELTIGLRPKK